MLTSECAAFAQAYADALTTPAALIGFVLGVVAVFVASLVRAVLWGEVQR